MGAGASDHTGRFVVEVVGVADPPTHSTGISELAEGAGVDPGAPGLGGGVELVPFDTAEAVGG